MGDQNVDHVWDDQKDDHIPNLLHSFDDSMSEVIMPSSLNNSIEDLLDFVSESLGLDSIPIDHSVQADDIVGPINESLDFLGFEPNDSQKHSLDVPNNVEVP